MTSLPGRIVWRSRRLDLERWLGLAEPLAAIHQAVVPPGVRVRPYSPYELDKVQVPPPWSARKRAWEIAIEVHHGPRRHIPPCSSTATATPATSCGATGGCPESSTGSTPAWGPRWRPRPSPAWGLPRAHPSTDWVVSPQRADRDRPQPLALGQRGAPAWTTKPTVKRSPSRARKRARCRPSRSTGVDVSLTLTPVNCPVRRSSTIRSISAPCRSRKCARSTERSHQAVCLCASVRGLARKLGVGRQIGDHQLAGSPRRQQPQDGAQLGLEPNVREGPKRLPRNDVPHVGVEPGPSLAGAHGLRHDLWAAALQVAAGQPYQPASPIGQRL